MTTNLPIRDVDDVSDVDLNSSGGWLSQGDSD